MFKYALLCGGLSDEVRVIIEFDVKITNEHGDFRSILFLFFTKLYWTSTQVLLNRGAVKA